MPDQAIVLCAGEGRRLRPLTETVPKALVAVDGKPLLDHALDHLRAAGVRRIAVNAWYLAEQVRDAGRTRDVHVEVEAELLGTGGGARNLLDWTGGRATYLTACDVLHDVDLSALAARHAEAGAEATMAVVDGDVERFGAVERDEDDRITDIIGALGRPGRPAVNASVHLLEPGFLQRLPPGPSCLVRDGYIPALRDGAVVAAYVHAGRWREVGSLESLE